MSLKLIEMQVALPRTYEAGKTAEQEQQRGKLSNDFAALEMERERDEKRISVNRLEHKAKAMLKQGSGNRQNDRGGDRERDGKPMDQQTEDHPYKGKIIDFSG